MTNPIQLARTILWFAFANCFVANAQLGTPKHESLNVPKILGGKRICTPGNHSVQFVDQESLLVLAGPNTTCYQSVNDLELVVISTKGSVLARKPWPSTFPNVVLAPKQIVVEEPGAIVLLDDTLHTVQTIQLPTKERSSVFLRKTPPDSLVAQLPRGEEFVYRGTPLRLIDQLPASSGETTIYSKDDGSWTVVLKGQQLIATSPAQGAKPLADLNWVFNCIERCQAYDAGFAFSVSSGGKLRAAFISNGSKFPVTDAAGLFPFCRILVLDLESGHEVYRKQFVTKTGQRSAQISPDGDLLALSDSDEISLQPLP